MSEFDERTDEELLRATRREPAAFAVFYRRHARIVLAYAARRLGDAELAADVTSEVFAAALAGSERFDPARGSARSWLFGILANQVGTALRSRTADSRARRRLGMEPIPLAEDQRAWIEELASEQDATLVRRLLAELPERERALLEERVVRGRDYGQLALEFGALRQGSARSGGAIPASSGGVGSASSGGADSAAGITQCGRLDAAGRGPWTAARAGPGQGLARLLGATAPVTGGARKTALRNLDQTVAQATTVYVNDIRTARLPGGRRVTLLAAQSCATVGMPTGESEWSHPEPSLLAEVHSADGVVTVPLGTVAQIWSGAAYRSQTLVVGRGRSASLVAMVPPGIVRVVCHLRRRGGVRRFPVVDHLVVMTTAASAGTCELV